MPQNLICRHTVGAVAAQPDREARGPALGTRGKCPGAARELRGTRKRHTGKNGILPSGAATYNDSAVASSGVSGRSFRIEVEVAVARVGGVRYASHTFSEHAKPQRGHISACTRSGGATRRPPRALGAPFLLFGYAV